MLRSFSVLFLSIALPLVAEQGYRDQELANYYLQNGGEVYFNFDKTTDAALIKTLTRDLSIDHVIGERVHAYANPAGFESFLKTGLPYWVQTHPGDLLGPQPMATTPAELKLEWDEYPTYDAYIAAMHEFASLYPELARVVKIGESLQGRDLLYMVISDNIGTTEAEPRHMYTSAMHGDETAMYVPFLRLIDYLLTNYASDDFVKNLVDNVEIWICPLENPDGTYRDNNNNVTNARRFNDNGLDLNRHYPRSGVPLTGNTDRDPEAQAVIDLIDSLDFVLSLNSHGGAELMNYPYDYDNVIHPDDDWMQYVYRAWADNVHAIDPSMLTDQNNGVVRGYVWYEVEGSRMDYVTFHKNMREVTFEATSTKLVPGSQFPEIWDVYHQALLNYIEQNLFGINGTVTSLNGGVAVEATITIVDHDNNQSFVTSKPTHGDFYRPIAEGTYTVEFSAEGFHTHTEENVVVEWDKATVLNIVMTPEGIGTHSYLRSAPEGIGILQQGQQIKFNFETAGSAWKAQIHGAKGQLLKTYQDGSGEGLETAIWTGINDKGALAPGGVYIISLETNSRKVSRQFVYTR